MAVVSHDVCFVTYDSPHNSYYNLFYNSCYLYLESPPVELVLITEEGIQRQISQMRENKPWIDTSISLETAQVKKGTKGRKGQRRGRPGKKKPLSTSTATEFDPGKIIFL